MINGFSSTDDMAIEEELELSEEEQPSKKRKRDEPEQTTEQRKIAKKIINKSLFELLVEVNKGDYSDFRAFLEQKNIPFLPVNLWADLNHTSKYSGANIAQALQDTAVKVLDFSNKQGLPEDELLNLCANLRGTQVKTLNFTRCNLSGENVVNILRSLRGGPIERICFHSNRIEAKHVKQIMQAVMVGPLKGINLGYNNLGLYGAQMIAQYLPKTHLTELRMHGCEIGADGAKIIAKSLPHCQLEVLRIGGGIYFRGQPIGDEGVIAISEQLPFCNLVDLGLSRSKMTGKGLSVLMDAIRRSSVTKLDIHRNPLASAESILLDGLMGSNLTHLSIWESFSDALIPKLANILNRTQLVSVSAGGNQTPLALQPGLKENRRRLHHTPYWIARLKGDPQHGRVDVRCLSFPNKRFNDLNSDDQMKFAVEVMTHAPSNVTQNIISFLPLMDLRTAHRLLSHCRDKHPQGIEKGYEGEDSVKQSKCTIM